MKQEELLSQPIELMDRSQVLVCLLTNDKSQEVQSEFETVTPYVSSQSSETDVGSQAFSVSPPFLLHF